jgi:hypothetical protein
LPRDLPACPHALVGYAMRFLGFARNDWGLVTASSGRRRSRSRCRRGNGSRPGR